MVPVCIGPPISISAVTVALLADDDGDGVLVAVGSKRIPLLVATGLPSSRAPKKTAAVGAEVVCACSEPASSTDVESEESESDDNPRRRFSLRPLNDTRAFWVVQETLFALNKLRISASFSGMLKLNCDSLNSRGRALPTVALRSTEDPSPTSVVVQLASSEMVHCRPENPFTQTQAQVLLLFITLTPPFMHGSDCWHWFVSVTLLLLADTV